MFNPFEYVKLDLPSFPSLPPFRPLPSPPSLHSLTSLPVCLHALSLPPSPSLLSHSPLPSLLHLRFSLCLSPSGGQLRASLPSAGTVQAGLLADTCMASRVRISISRGTAQAGGSALQPALRRCRSRSRRRCFGMQGWGRWSVTGLVCRWGYLLPLAAAGQRRHFQESSLSLSKAALPLGDVEGA